LAYLRVRGREKKDSKELFNSETFSGMSPSDVDSARTSCRAVGSVKHHLQDGHARRAAGKGCVARPSATTPKRACARQHLPRLRAPGEALLSPPSFSVRLDEPRDHGKSCTAKTVGLATGYSPLVRGPAGCCEFMYKRGSYRHTWHPTLRALGVASMQPGVRLDVQEHTRNARSRSLV